MKGSRTELTPVKPTASHMTENWLGIEDYTEEDVERATDLQLRDSVPDGKLSVLTSRKFMSEYGCHTASERATARIAANALARVFENSRILSELTKHDNASQLYINLYSTISKELDRANRQYETAVSTLIRMKSPAFRVNVLAKTAFVGRNQQFTVKQNNNENIEPK